MELYPISTVGNNLPSNGSSQLSGNGSTSKGSGHTQQTDQEDIDNCNQPLLNSTPNKMETVKSVLHNGTGRIAPHGTPDQTNNGSGGGNNASKCNNNSDNHEEIPNDRYNIVFYILLIHGIGILMPWNMFINAFDYFADYKLTIHHKDGTNEASAYKEYFLSWLGLASQVPNVLCNFLNIFFQFGGSTSIRITSGIVVEILIIILTIALAILDTSDYISGFFYLTLISVVLLNIANGIYQNSLYGVASKLPMKYTNAVVLGSNISGTFTSVVKIVTTWMSPNLRIAAVYYFVSALFILLVCFDSFLGLPINRFYRYYVLDNRHMRNKDIEEKLVEDDSNDSNTNKERPPIWKVFCMAWKQCVNVFLVFFVTLSIFPVIQSDVKPVDENFFGSVETTNKYFSNVCCFLVFNMFAMIGNIIPNYVTIPGPDRLWIPVMLRFIFIPLFLYCNYAPTKRVWPVLIESDWIFIIAGIAFGLSSGYLSSLCMMYAPKTVPPEYAGTAGMIAAACLILGIFCGINFSSFLAWLVK